MGLGVGGVGGALGAAGATLRLGGFFFEGKRSVCIGEDCLHRRSEIPAMYAILGRRFCSRLHLYA